MERQRASGDKEKRIGYLQQSLASNYLEMAVKELTDRFETMASIVPSISELGFSKLDAF